MKPVPTVSGVPQDVARGRVFVLIDAATDAPLLVEVWDCPPDAAITMEPGIDRVEIADGVEETVEDPLPPSWKHVDHGPRCKLLARRALVASDEVDDVYDACDAMFGADADWLDRSGKTRSRMYAALEGIARLRALARSVGADEGRVYAGAKRGLVQLEGGL